MKVLVISCLVFAAMAIGTPSFVSAEDVPDYLKPVRQGKHAECKADTAEDLPRVTTTRFGEPLETLGDWRFDDYHIQMPVGYLKGFPKIEVQKCEDGDCARNLTELPKSNGFGFHFWMPEGRYPEWKSLHFPVVQPCEPGRPRPQEHKFVVNVQFWSFHLNEDFAVSARRSVEAGVEWATTPHLRWPESQPRFDRELGFFWWGRKGVSLENRKTWDENESWNSIWYAAEYGGTLVRGNCARHICRLRVWKESQSLVGEIAFGRHWFDDWRAVLDKTDELMSKWIQGRVMDE